MGEIEHEFQELGLPIGGGWSFGSIDGKVTVEFDSAGDWWIVDIFVDIRKLVGSEWKTHTYMLDKTKPNERRWYHELKSLIETEEKAAIDEAVSEELPLGAARSTINAGRTL